MHHANSPMHGDTSRSAEFSAHGSSVKPGSGSSVAELFADPALQGRRLNLSAGDVIFEPTSVANRVYLLVRGQVRLYHVGTSAETRLVEILGPNDWFGVGALAQQPTQAARAIAVVPTTVIEVAVDRLVAVVAQKPQSLLEFNRQLAMKLQGARDDAATLIFEDCNARLIRALLRFSNTAASTHREGDVILRITHHQLAQAVGVARETVSLALTQLRHRNLLRTGRNQLVFNPEALRRFREGGPRGESAGTGSASKRGKMSPEVEPVA
jgi:CRP-like cAMP-binding protein